MASSTLSETEKKNSGSRTGAVEPVENRQLGAKCRSRRFSKGLCVSELSSPCAMYR